MKKRLQKRILLIALAALVCLAVSGCGKGGETQETGQTEAAGGEERDGQPEEAEKKQEAENESPEGSKTEDPKASSDKSTEQTDGTPAQEEASLCGDVYDLGNQKFILNKATVEEDENGTEIAVMTIPSEESSMSLVTVSYDDATEFYKRTIRDGGASYEDSASSADELTKGTSVELWGSYEGEIFHASQIQIVDVIF